MAQKNFRTLRRRAALFGTLLATLCGTGCSREFWHQRADREVAYLVAQKSNDPRWGLPPGFNLNIDPRSRYFDPNNVDRPPMPPDDPASHQFMHYVDGKRGYGRWHVYGDLRDLPNPGWRERLGEYMDVDANGVMKLDLNGSVGLAYIHSPDHRQQLETLYLSALDVSTERFSFNTQFFAGSGPSWTHNGRKSGRGRILPGVPPVRADRNTLNLNTDAQARRRFATGGTLLVGFANSFVWQFAGPNTNFTSSLVNFNLVQPLLRAGGRVVALEQLTIVERALLANLRAYQRYRQGFYTNIVIGDGGAQGPSRRGGFFGGTGLTGFTGTGAGGIGGVGAGTFGNFGGGGGGGAGGGTATAGTAGGGAGNVGGFIGLLQQQQQIRNTQDNLNMQLRTLRLLEANLEAGLIDLTQVDLFRQSIETARANLLQSQIGLQNQLDTFKRITLGLPPDLEITLDDTMIQQFRLVDRRMTELRYRFGDFIDRVGNMPDEPAVGDIETALEDLTAMREDVGQRFSLVRTALQQMEDRSPERVKRMVAEERRLFQTEKLKLYDNLAEAETRFQDSQAALDMLRDGLTPDTTGRVAEGLVALADGLSGLTQELSLIQARARVETITLEPVVLAPEEALQIARNNRLDWMNNRASLVDTWRLIAFQANTLRSNLTVSLSGDVGTVGNNPLAFQAPTGNVTAGLRFDAPITRLIERNNYRSSLINYQQARRQLIQFDDSINQTMRQNMRTLGQLEQNLEIQRNAVAIAVRRVDQTREDLNRPPPVPQPGQPGTALGPTAAQNLLQALNALSDSQNALMSVWLNHYATRMTLMRDLGLMQLDENGLWIDRPLDEVLAEVRAAGGAGCELPPEVPAEWFRDANVDPDQLPPPGEGVTPPAPDEGNPPAYEEGSSLRTLPGPVNMPGSTTQKRPTGGSRRQATPTLARGERPVEQSPTPAASKQEGPALPMVDKGDAYKHNKPSVLDRMADWFDR